MCLAPKTLYEFNLLPYEYQLVVALDYGTFLATRWKEDAVNLYHLPVGVFAEFYYDTHVNQIVRAFTSAGQLEDYAVYIVPAGRAK